MGRLIFAVLAAIAGWAAWRWFQNREASFDQSPVGSPLDTYRQPVDPGQRTAPDHPMTNEQTTETGVGESKTSDHRPSATVEDIPPPATPQEPETQREDIPPLSVSVQESGPAMDGLTPPYPIDSLTAGSEQPVIEAYCMRCKEHRPMIEAHEETTANGRRALRGLCSVCGAKMFRFLPDKE